MAGELMSFGIQKLWDLLNQEDEQFRGVRDQVNELKTDLNTLKSFLKDADAKKHTSARVKNCVEVIKEIIFDAEDIIETFILKNEIRKSGGIKKRIKRLVCIIPEHRKIALEIGGISKRISKVIRDMQTYGVQHIIDDVSDSQPIRERLEFATKYESNLVGLKENVQKLVGYLVEEDDIQVVSMTGMGGLGKTTLARQAFNHDMVKSKFDRLVWVCVSQDCDLKNVWQTILRTLKPNEEEKKISEMTESTLQGSKVLLTSRNENVAGRGEKYINFKPKCLSNQDSWTLLQRITAPSKDALELDNVSKEMEEMGKKMIEHCGGGLPLAVRVLGGFLAANYVVHDWKRISENIGSHLVGTTNDDNNNSFNRVLSLSYEELPNYLKYCFLYLAHFPEDYEINVEDLSYLWAAEGMLRYNDGETIRDVGDSYINELVRRNMVISERDNTTSKFETCGLHDLMRDLCLSKAKEENFLQIVGIPYPTAHSQSLSISRRFVAQYPRTLHVKREINNSKVRSFMDVIRKDTRSGKLSSISFKRLQLLRVLHLPSTELEGSKLPYSTGKLIHLKYLNLEEAFVSNIPSSLGKLKLLIYLNLNVLGFYIFVPNVLMEMKELRYLALPRRMDEKTKLELGHLVNLETLINFSTENGSLEDLRGMARLRTLKIRLRGERSLKTLSASIGGWRHLENLFIDYRGAARTKEWRTILEFNNLKQLKLSARIPLLSDELQFPSRLTRLKLKMCDLKEDPMPILEKLGQLKEVSLHGHSFDGKRMVCSRGGFPQLQTLCLKRLNEWEEWIVEEGSMPLLHTLTIHNCKKLKELPDGLRFITSLKNLTVKFMRKEWAERLSEGGEDYYKVQHISSVEFYHCDE